jgi:hypothetical protein
MRDYVSIAPRYKSLAYCRGLIGPMLETEPATASEIPWRLFDEVLECREGIGACGEGEQRFEGQRIRLQHGIIRLDIGRIRSDELEVLICERLEP